jgi:hypothetical protein
MKSSKASVDEYSGIGMKHVQCAHVRLLGSLWWAYWLVDFAYTIPNAV